MDGQSHVVHSEEEAMGTRLTIDSLTCLLANETDPSRLLAISPGKLMRYLVPDESFVVQDQPYAEIEVGLQYPHGAAVSESAFSIPRTGSSGWRSNVLPTAVDLASQS